MEKGREGRRRKGDAFFCGVEGERAHEVRETHESSTSDLS